MIQRFKGITTDLTSWKNSSKIIPDELWCLVSMPDGSIGLKIGNGKDVFSDLVWIVNPEVYNTFITKPDTETPANNKFLNELGNYIEINPDGSYDVDKVLTDFEAQGLEVPTTEEVEWIRAQMYNTPLISAFRSSSTLFGKVPMGTNITGTIPFSWTLSNKENAGVGSIKVSEGTWDNNEGISLSEISSVNLTLNTADISSQKIKTLSFTLTGVDSKGNAIPPKTLNVTWTHKIYWGTSSVKEISGINDLSNRNESMQNTRNLTTTFNPINQQYSIILIPDEIPQNNINIVNKNSSAIDHSYNMNTGNGGTESLYNLNINGILYRAYVSYGTTASPSTAIIK